MFLFFFTFLIEEIPFFILISNNVYIYIYIYIYIYCNLFWFLSNYRNPRKNIYFLIEEKYINKERRNYTTKLFIFNQV